MFVNFNILNQLGSPAINSNTFANRPAAGQTGRLFVSTDTYEIYRDNGTTWDLIGGPGSSTITGSGTATQVAYFTSSQAIGSSANLFWDNTNTRLGIGTATPGAALDIHSTGIMAHFNTTSATGNTYIAFQRTGTNVWRLGDQYNAGENFFQIHNTALSNNAIEIATATNKSIFTALQTYTTGLARGNYFDYNLSVAAGGSFSSPNAITALGASLDLTLAGSATIPSGARSGLDAYNTISFTGTGTLTQSQGTYIRAYSNLTTGWAFAGSATGTVTHLAGLRVLFPDNTGSAVTIDNNYALLLNDQTANTGTVTYTNRWGIYQEGASDLNYLNANLLLGSTTNSGQKLQVTGSAYISSTLLVGITSVYGDEIARFYNSFNAGRYVYVENPNTGSSAASFVNVLAGAGADLRLGAYGTNHTTQANNATIFNHKATGSLLFGTVGSERMRLDASGNLGLGVTPSAWYSTGYSALQVKGLSLYGASGNDGNLVSNAYLSTTPAWTYLTTGTASRYEQGAGAHKWFTAPSGTAGNAISFTQAMTLDASGNLGLGVTPSAWGSSIKAMQIGVSGAVARDNTNNRTHLGDNVYFNSSNAATYIESTKAALYTINFGTHEWRIAPSGTAGNAISFTQAMTLDASGRLGIGTSSPTQLLHINNSSATSTVMLASNSAGSSGVAFGIHSSGAGYIDVIQSNALFFATNDTERMRITSGGNTLIGTTTDAGQKLQVNGTVATTSSITTGAPAGGTAAAWKLGSRVAAAVALDATQYIQVDIGGTLYKLAIVI